MNTHFNLFIKKVACLLCILMISTSLNVLTCGKTMGNEIVHNTVDYLPSSVGTTDNVPAVIIGSVCDLILPVTTGGACNLVLPVTTDSACDLVPSVTTDGAYDIVPDITTPSVYTILKADKTSVCEGEKEIVQFEIEIGALNHVNLFELEMEYDEKQLTYIGEEILLEHSLIINKQVKQGKIFMTFGLMKAQDLEEGQKIIRLQFETKDSLKENELVRVTLNEWKMVTINEEDETESYNGVTTPQVLTLKVEGKVTADINKDGNVTLEDLSIALKYYGVDRESLLWEVAKKCDVIKDEIINIADLVEISSKRIGINSK